MSGSKCLTLGEVSRAYNYSPSEILDLCKKGLIPHIKQEPNPGQSKYLFPDKELAQKLFPRPITEPPSVSLEPKGEEKTIETPLLRPRPRILMETEQEKEVTSTAKPKKASSAKKAR